MLTLPGGFPAADTGSMPLASTLQPVELGFKRSRLDASASWLLGQGWSTRLSLRHDVRDGTQRTAGSFFSTASQMAAPVDQVTDQVEISASYFSPRLQATLGYQGSLFRNGQESLTWTNPFSGVRHTGQLALAPDNQFHQIFGSAGYEITPTDPCQRRVRGRPHDAGCGLPRRDDKRLRPGDEPIRPGRAGPARAVA